MVEYPLSIPNRSIRKFHRTSFPIFGLSEIPNLSWRHQKIKLVAYKKGIRFRRFYKQYM